MTVVDILAIGCMFYICYSLMRVADSLEVIRQLMYKGK